MSSSFDDQLLKWANGNKSRKDKWKEELFANDIDDMDSLKSRAQGSRWQSTLMNLSDGLVTELEKWASHMQVNIVDELVDVSFHLYNDLTAPFHTEPCIEELSNLLQQPPLCQFPVHPTYLKLL